MTVRPQAVSTLIENYIRLNQEYPWRMTQLPLILDRFINYKIMIEPNVPCRLY